MKERRRVDVALLIVALVWGSSYPAAQQVVTPHTVFAFLAIRFALAAVGLAIIAAPALRRTTRAEMRWGAVFGVILGVVFTLESFGVTMTSASHAGLIISSTIVITPVVDRWVRGTYLPRGFCAAGITAVSGVGLLTQSGGLQSPRPGDYLFLAAAFARAVHVTVIARVSDHHRLNPVRVTFVQTMAACAVSTGLAHLTGQGLGDLPTDPRTWLLIGYLALMCTVFAFVVQVWAVRRASPARASLILGTEPLWAAGFGVFVAGDPVTAVGLLGALLILLGTQWGRLADSRPEPLV